jgi:hypothetical protein
MGILLSSWDFTILPQLFGLWASTIGENAPTFVQNMFHGPFWIPITPRMGYTMYGAMLGVYHYKTM